MNVFTYIRVSSAGQIEKDGPVRQRQAMQNFCDAHNLSIASEAFEEGVSGTVEAMDRPAFSDMIEVIEKRKESPEPIEAIVVERLDRLARDLMVSEFLLAECRKRGIKVFATDQGQLIDMANSGDDPTRKLLRQILGAVAEWEKSALVAKLRAARDRVRREKGRCEGALEYGSTPEEAQIKLMMVRLAQAGYSLQRIARDLNAAGFKTRFGRPWLKATVYSVMAKRRCNSKKKKMNQ